MRSKISTALLFYLFLLVSCNQNFRSASAEFKNYNVEQKKDGDSKINVLIKPYSDSINGSMNNVIGENESLLEKSARNNTLGFFMTDAFLLLANQKFNVHVDVAFMNHGGIRLNDLAAGKITNGKIFELMPFDNLLFIQKVKGNVLKQYLDSVAFWGPMVQSGLTMRISNKKPEDIKVGNKPLDENADYVISNSDYVINNSEVLKNIPSQNIGYLQRDAIIDYVLMLTQKGKKIVVENTERVKYAE
jgi:2',3'-cyclic-nucleotide 2'-phosphodiesterase (5'-nucleotidase family)